MPEDSIYLDYNATTPVDPRVAEAMQPFIRESYGNPSSIHSFGVTARIAVENARKQVADLLGCFPDEIIFTSGGTESNNYAIKGAAFANVSRGKHIITSSIEHPSVTEVCKYLETIGFSITWLPVNEFCQVDPADVEKNITPSTILISVMHANNETGTIQPISAISGIAKKYGIVFHTDAAQSCGKIPVNIKDLGCDLLSVAGHKLYAPKGIGALYIRRGVVLEKLIHGADHEQNKRAGTENVIEIVGLGKAAEISRQFAIPGSQSPAESRQPGVIGHQSLVIDKESTITRQSELRDLLHDGIKSEIPEIRLNGHIKERLPNTLNISFPGIEANRLLDEMKEVAASAGAACHSDRTDISPVLSAMGVPVKYAMGSIRFSVGRFTTGEEIQRATGIITSAAKRLSYPDRHMTIPAPVLSGIRLTQYTHGLGCACKIRPRLLESILKEIPLCNDPDVLVDQQTSDDAAVYRINETTGIVQTIDFIPPVVDDPYAYGAISAANALSDVYAMGGKPLFALSIVAFPDKLLPIEVLMQIIKGATDKAKEAGISIIGGHTIEDTEPKFGLVVTGKIDPKRIIRNSGAVPGDAVILTKPIGTGILATALKRGLLTTESEKEITRVMSSLNRKASEIMLEFPVNACTDITGFGLLGHLSEMTTGANIGAVIHAMKVPVLPGVWELVTANVIPGGTKNNLDFISGRTTWNSSVPELLKIILADAQTSGGLLIAVPDKYKGNLVDKLHHSGIDASMIGNFTDEHKKIHVKYI
ncbi:MAG: selenide, water dikinase SelD [Bacteroidetes bacterium]|nr:selenide, water dikinase SelD [Bacteroidota bacterium]